MGIKSRRHCRFDGCHNEAAALAISFVLVFTLLPPRRWFLVAVTASNSTGGIALLGSTHRCRRCKHRMCLRSGDYLRQLPLQYAHAISRGASEGMKWGPVLWH
jgi:hypothetical protein